MTTPIKNEHLVRVLAEHIVLEGSLTLPERAQGIVLFAHSSGSLKKFLEQPIPVLSLDGFQD